MKNIKPLFPLAAGIAFVLMNSVPAMGLHINDSLLKNGSFEQGLESWRTSWVGPAGKVGITQGDAVDGKNYLSVKVTESANSRLILRSQSIVVDTQEIYELSLNYYTGDQNARGTSVRIVAYDKNTKVIGYYSAFGVPPTAHIWVQEQKTFSLPSNCHRIVLEINFRNGVDCRVDNIQLRKVDSAKQAALEDFYKEKNPLFEELLIEGTKPSNPRPMPYWGYDISDASMYRNAALRYGHEYVLEDRYKELAKKNWANFDYQGKFLELRQKTNTPTNYFIFERGHFLDHAFTLARRRGAPVFSREQPSPIDPIYVDAVIELLQDKDTLINRKNRPRPAFVMFVDELFLKTAIILPPEKRTSEFWKNADEQIRQKYGFGKYGMPKSTGDKDPLRWIAYLRWQSENSVNALSRIAQAAKKAEPSIQFLGTDEYNIPTPYDWEKIAEHVDIQMNQVLPLPDGWSSFTPGFVTKFMGDLSGKPVYPYLQVIKYGNTPHPEMIHNWTNQVLRAGGQGLFVGAVEWFDRDLNHPMYTAPENWQFYTDLVQQVQNLPAIRYPEKAEVALHYSSFSNMANGRTQNARRFGAAYAFLGPRAGSWFQVTDDFQLERNPEKWKDYPVVVAPDMDYVSGASLKSMREYASQGGTLIFTNPDSLSFRIDGEDIQQDRQDILGVKFGERTVQRSLVWSGIELNNPTGYANSIVRLNPNAKAIATFTDDSPAIIERSLGKGRIITFAFDPLESAAVNNPAWQQAWIKILDRYNVKTNQAIWRFTLPMPRRLQKPKDICITNNAVWMHQNQVDLSLNKEIGGKYWYSRRPQAITDTRDDAIPFPEGKLTNRVAMATAAKNDRGGIIDATKRKLETSIVKFGEDETAATDITFQFNQGLNLTRARIAFSGYLPRTKVQTSNDGENWQDGGIIESINAEEDVILREIPINTMARFIRFQLAERPVKSSLTLSEIDIWTKASEPFVSAITE